MECPSDHQVKQLFDSPTLKGKSVFLEAVSNGAETPRIIVARKPRPMHELGRFVMVSQVNLEALASTKALPGRTPLLILVFLLSRLDYTGTSSLNVGKTAKQLGTARSAIYRALDALCKAQLIRRVPDPDVHRGNPTVMVNPFFAARGRSKDVDLLQHFWESGAKQGVDKAPVALHVVRGGQVDAGKESVVRAEPTILKRVS